MTSNMSQALSKIGLPIDVTDHDLLPMLGLREEEVMRRHRTVMEQLKFRFTIKFFQRNPIPLFRYTAPDATISDLFRMLDVVEKMTFISPDKIDKTK